MISTKLQQMLNEQMKTELYSAYFYLAMRDWFEARSLKGFANWYDVQVKEERDHALRIRKFLLSMDAAPQLLAIEAPDQDFTDVADVLQRTLAHEQLISSKINDIMEVAQAERDYRTILFMEWYVVEQIEEEENCRELIDRLKLAQHSQGGILFMDEQLQKRAYNPPAEKL